MAISAIPTKNSIIIHYESGVDGRGQPKFVVQKLSKVSTNLSDEDFFEFGVALTKLLDSQNCAFEKEVRISLTP